MYKLVTKYIFKKKAYLTQVELFYVCYTRANESLSSSIVTKISKLPYTQLY